MRLDLVVILFHGEVRISRYGMAPVIEMNVLQLITQVGKVVIDGLSCVGHLIHIHHTNNSGRIDLSNHLCQILAGNEDVSSGYLQLLQQQSNPLALGVGSQSPHTLPAEFPGFLARHFKVSKPGADLNRGAFQKLGGINRTLVVADAGLPGQGILSAEIHWINAVFRGHGHN